MGMQKSDLPLEERRMWFNALARKMKNPAYVAALPPGALEKYQAAASGSNERFQLLKAFMCDESLKLVWVDAFGFGFLRWVSGGWIMSLAQMFFFIWGIYHKGP